MESFMDLTRGSLPILAVVAICAGIFSLGAVYDRFIFTQDSTDGRVTKLEMGLKELQSSVNVQGVALAKVAERLGEISEALKARSFDVYRFCLGLERVNKDRGFICPSDL
jgi:hypothetical protein